MSRLYHARGSCISHPMTPGHVSHLHGVPPSGTDHLVAHIYRILGVFKRFQAEGPKRDLKTPREGRLGGAHKKHLH